MTGFMLRLDTGPRTYDFRTGMNGWGHALHSGTWRELPPRKQSRGLFRKPDYFARASFMVHTSPSPRVGDRVLFSGASGADRDVAIVDVESCFDPRDMFTLTVEFDRPPQSPLSATGNAAKRSTGLNNPSSNSHQEQPQ